MDLNQFRFKLLCIATLFLFVFKLFNTTALVPIIVNSLIEFSVFFIIFYIFEKLPKVSSWPAKLMEKFSYYALFAFNFLVFFMTNYYFNDTLSMKYSFYNFSFGSFGFLIESIIRPGAIIFFAVTFSIILLAARINLKSITFRSLYVFIVCLGIIGFSLFTYDPINNAYATTIHDVSNSVLSPTLEIEGKNITKEFDRPYEGYEEYDLDEQRVLVFVMEQVDYNTFTKELSGIPEQDNFFHRVNSSSHWYTNYYTTNQDSRTGLWTMLGSRFLPFEAYTTEWDEKYGYILEEPNLIELFNYHNYSTKVAASMYESTLLLGAYEWDQTVFLKEYPREDFLCVDNLEYQKGCEDFALIDDVKDQLSEEKQLIFQELIFGHGEKYLEESGKSRTEYYNDYLNQIYSYLENNSLLENTTIVVVSDHGEKGYFDKEISNYHIPLVIINENLESENIDSLHSHLSFKDILLSYLGEEEAKPLEETMVMGQSQSNEIAYINSQNEYFTGKLNGHEIELLEYTLPHDTIKDRAGQLLTLKQRAINKSASKYYYCEQCEAIDQKVHNAR